MINSLSYAALSLAVALMCGPAFANSSWTDPASGRAYVLLDGIVSYSQLQPACQRLGFAGFDERFLTPTETTALMQSRLFGGLAWESLHPGTAAATRLAKVWGAAEWLDLAGSSAAVLVLSQPESRPMISTSEIHDIDSPAAQGICMSVPGFWYRCTGTVACKGGFSTHFADYGASESEARHRILDRVQDPNVAVSTGDCPLDVDSVSCARLLP